MTTPGAQRPQHESPARPRGAPHPAAPPTPIASFTQLERERQSEWLFRRYRAARPAWKRD